MLASVVPVTIHPGARRPLIPDNMSNAAQSGQALTFYFHVLQYVFFNKLIYKGL
ncbi:MAG: hypothetical protein ACRCYW_07435 [Aeromonas sp.]|uniref:hypothetical protein n=1 Tax=Aeromonas sp. TaxID=647 RepID=UPI003F38B13C